MAFRNIVLNPADFPSIIDSLQVQIAHYKSINDYTSTANCQFNLAQQIRRCPSKLYVDPAHQVKHQAIALTNALANITKVAPDAKLNQSLSILVSHIFIEIKKMVTGNKSVFLKQTDAKIIKRLQTYCEFFKGSHPHTLEIWNLIATPSHPSIINTIQVTPPALSQPPSRAPSPHSDAIVQALLSSPKASATHTLRSRRAVSVVLPQSLTATPKNAASLQAPVHAAQSTFATVMSNKWLRASLFAAGAFVLAETGIAASAVIGVTTAATLNLIEQKCRRR